MVIVFRPGPVIDAADGPLASAAAGRARATIATSSRRFIGSSLRRWRRNYTARRWEVPWPVLRVRGRANECGLEVGDQVVGRLDPDGEADQVPRRRRWTRLRGGVGHPRRMLDQALDSAQALGEDPDVRAPDDLNRLLLRLDEERDHAAEVAHLAGGDVVARVIRQSRVERTLDGRVTRQELGHRPRVLTVLTHADGERLDPAQDEPAVEGPRNGPEGLLEKGEALRDRDVVEGVALGLVHLREHAVDAPVDVVHGHDALPGVDEVHDGGHRA